MIHKPLSVIAAAILCGCVQPAPKSPPVNDQTKLPRNPEQVTPDIYPQGAKALPEPVVRYGRYSLVSTSPTAEQQDLLSQIIDTRIPAGMKPSVKEGLEHILKKSGYSLCNASNTGISTLYTRPLPAAHYSIGPMTLRNALQVVAGPAYKVETDDVLRQVCFVLRPEYEPKIPVVPASATSVNAYAVSSPIKSGTPARSFAAPAYPVRSERPVAAPSIASSIVAPQKRVVLYDRSKQTSTLSPPATAITSVKSSLPIKVLPPTQSSIAATPAVPAHQVWKAAEGDTLRQSVEKWAKQAGWKVTWNADDLDYPIEAPLQFQGSFQDALKGLFPLYDSALRSFVVNASILQKLVVVEERKQ